MTENDTLTQSQLPTYGQLLVKHGGDLTGVNIRPNTSHPAEIIFEPTATGAKSLTVYTTDHRALLAFIASKEHTERIHTTVALYSQAQDMIAAELGTPKQGEASEEEAEASIAKLEETIAMLKRSIRVKNPNAKNERARRSRAYSIACLARDADTFIQNGAAPIRALKKKTNDGATEAELDLEGE